MPAHLIDGEFQSDKYPTTPRGKVPLSVKDPSAQDLLWAYAQRRRKVDGEFSDDLETALRSAGYSPPVMVTDDLRTAAAFIAASREAVPELEAALQAAEARAQALQAVLRRIAAGNFDCHWRQWFMAAQGIAEDALSQGAGDTGGGEHG